MSYGTGKSGFNKALEKGTAPTQTEPDWDAIVALSDLIKSGEVKPKYAIDAIMKKIGGDNQIVAQRALQILESVVKNCGPRVHDEVANPAFMSFLKSQLQTKTDAAKNKILELVQCWAHAFRSKTEYKAVTDTYNELKSEGHQFPKLCEADAMFSAEVMPEWKEVTSCFYCRTAFGTFTRRHHCRACGQSCCGSCSSKKSTIPKFGVEQEVRVCDSCYGKLNPASATSGGSGQSSASKKEESESDLPAEYLNSALYKQSLEDQKTKEAASSGGKSEAELEEEEQLQLALAISQSEEEAKLQEKKKRQTYMSLDATPPSVVASFTPPVSSAPVVELEENMMSPELQKYLNRDYWEKKEKENKSAPAASSARAAVSSGSKTAVKSAATAGDSYNVVTTPSAPPPSYTEPQYTTTTSMGYEANEETPSPNGPVLEEDETEREEFIKNISSSIDVFVNRMKSNSMRGRSIINDSAVQTLFATLQNMHPHLLGYMQKLEEKRSTFEGLQDKLAQLKDAREALNALRQEHEEKRRIEAEERAKRKQLQMMQKLDILRKQKQQVLERQRMMAMQQLQQHEAEMQARMEQQKQLAQMRQMQLHGFPQDLQATYGYGQPNPGQYGTASQYYAPQGSEYEAYVPHGPQMQPAMTQGSQGYMHQPPGSTVGYPGQLANPYNMQAMSEALPPQSSGENPAYQMSQPQYSMAGQEYMPPPPQQHGQQHPPPSGVPQQGAVPPQNVGYNSMPMYQYAPSAGHPAPGQQFNMPPQQQQGYQQPQQQPPPPQESGYAELISFD